MLVVFFASAQSNGKRQPGAPTPEASIDQPMLEINNPGVEPTYTETQGQYLAFIYYYTKIHSVSPAEADMQRYFNVAPPSVHTMVVTLDKRRLISRTPGAGRSIRLLLSREQLPDLK
jgi:DNA-binding MarR family transcriptional regulator